MMKKMIKKLKSQAGESIGETLVSMLIAALALLMLAGAMSASAGVIVKSRGKLSDYYDNNEEESGVVKMLVGGTAANDGVTITDSSHAISTKSYSVTYFKNDEFGKKTVVAYKLPSFGTISDGGSDDGSE